MLRAVIVVLAASAGACSVDAGDRALPEDVAARVAALRDRARGDPDALVESAELLLEAGRLFEAADLLLDATRRGVSSARVHAGLARAYQDLGYARSTYEAVQACFRIEPEHPDCLLIWGQFLERDPRPEAQREVQRTFATLLRVAPDHRGASYARSALAQLESTLGPSEPVKTATAAEEPEDPEFAQALQAAYDAWGVGDRARARTQLRAALELQPDEPTALAELGRLEAEAGNPEAAMELVDRAYAADPSRAEVRFAFGLVMLKNRQRGREAIQAWRDLVRDTPAFAREVGVNQLLEQIGVASPTGAAPLAGDQATAPPPDTD